LTEENSKMAGGEAEAEGQGDGDGDGEGEGARPTRVVCNTSLFVEGDEGGVVEGEEGGVVEEDWDDDEQCEGEDVDIYFDY
jgi:hypothetical protein